MVDRSPHAVASNKRWTLDARTDCLAFSASHRTPPTATEVQASFQIGFSDLNVSAGSLGPRPA